MISRKKPDTSALWAGLNDEAPALPQTDQPTYKEYYATIEGKGKAAARMGTRANPSTGEASGSAGPSSDNTDVNMDADTPAPTSAAKQTPAARVGRLRNPINAVAVAARAAMTPPPSSASPPILPPTSHQTAVQPAIDRVSAPSPVVKQAVSPIMQEAFQGSTGGAHSRPVGTAAAPSARAGAASSSSGTAPASESAITATAGTKRSRTVADGMDVKPGEEDLRRAARRPTPGVSSMDTEMNTGGASGSGSGSGSAGEAPVGAGGSGMSASQPIMGTQSSSSCQGNAQQPASSSQPIFGVASSSQSSQTSTFGSSLSTIPFLPNLINFDMQHPSNPAHQYTILPTDPLLTLQTKLQALLELFSTGHTLSAQLNLLEGVPDQYTPDLLAIEGMTPQEKMAWAWFSREEEKEVGAGSRQMPAMDWERNRLEVPGTAKGNSSKVEEKVAALALIYNKEPEEVTGEHVSYYLRPENAAYFPLLTAANRIIRSRKHCANPSGQGALHTNPRYKVELTALQEFYLAASRRNDSLKLTGTGTGVVGFENFGKTLKERVEWLEKGLKPMKGKDIVRKQKSEMREPAWLRGSQ